MWGVGVDGGWTQGAGLGIPSKQKPLRRLKIQKLPRQLASCVSKEGTGSSLDALLERHPLQQAIGRFEPNERHETVSATVSPPSTYQLGEGNFAMHHLYCSNLGTDLHIFHTEKAPSGNQSTCADTSKIVTLSCHTNEPEKTSKTAKSRCAQVLDAASCRSAGSHHHTTGCDWRIPGSSARTAGQEALPCRRTCAAA